MRILMAMHSLAMGGAEKFFLNLAHALAEKHEVTCYIPALRCSDAAMLQRLGTLPTHRIAWFTPFTYRVFYKLTLMMQRRFPTFDPESALHTRQLLRLHAQHRFEVVNAHLMPAARQVCTAFEHTALPITKSDHGDTASASPADAVVFRRLDALICPAEANARKARTYPLRSDCRITTIPYGYRGNAVAVPALPAFAGLTFGMVARGVADKGWVEAVAATRLVRQRTTQPLRLVLVGAGPCLDELQRDLPAVDREWVIFAGQQSEPERWIQSFDVGLLPTCLAEESLPNSIIEYLACGKPVIATAIGGIAEMTGKAGRLIPLAANGRADVAALAEAMVSLADHERRSELAHHSSAAFRRFDMSTCVQAYQDAFAQVLAA